VVVPYSAVCCGSFPGGGGRTQFSTVVSSTPYRIRTRRRSSKGSKHHTYRAKFGARCEVGENRKEGRGCRGRGGGGLVDVV
jgi:hypothetical protein